MYKLSAASQVLRNSAKADPIPKGVQLLRIISLQQQSQPLLLTQRVQLFSNTQTSLFSERLKKLRQSIKDTPDTRDDQPRSATEGPPTTEGIPKRPHSKTIPDLVQPELVYSMELEDVLAAMKRARADRTPRQSNDFFMACLERINSLTIERNSKVTKSDLIAILRELTHIRPKEDDEKDRMRRQQGLFTKSELQDDLLSVRHKRLIEEKSNKFRTVPGDMANFVYTNLTKGFFRDLFTQYDDEQTSKMRTSLFDMLASYIQLFQNIEVRINDMLSTEGAIDPKDALDVLVSYSIAEEGTNTLYIRLVECMLKRREDYSMVEVEMVLNYFPHSIWKNEQGLISLREGFYYPLLAKVKEAIDKVDKRQYLSLFQGLTLAGEIVFKVDVLNTVLNSYAKRLQPDGQAAETKFTLKEVMAFLELMIQFLRTSSNILEQIDTAGLLDFTNRYAISPQISSMNMHEISGVYWAYRNLPGTGSSQWDPKVIQPFEERIAKLLREELLIQKALDRGHENIKDENEGLQTMSLRDLEVIEHYYSTDESLLESSQRHKELLKLIKQARHWDKPEIERKWFHI